MLYSLSVALCWHPLLKPKAPRWRSLTRSPPALLFISDCSGIVGFLTTLLPPHPPYSGSPAPQASLSIRPVALTSPVDLIFLGHFPSKQPWAFKSEFSSPRCAPAASEVLSPYTQDAESPFRRCEQENLPTPFGQAFHTWKKAAVESLGWGGVKGKKDVAWKSVVISFSGNLNLGWD